MSRNRLSCVKTYPSVLSLRTSPMRSHWATTILASAVLLSCSNPSFAACEIRHRVPASEVDRLNTAWENPSGFNRMLTKPVLRPEPVLK